MGDRGRKPNAGAIPGIKVAWESAAHVQMTRGGLSLAQTNLPPELRQILSWLSDLPQKVVEQDYSWANLTGVFGYNPKGGQVAHFMKDEGQSDIEAYDLSKDLILASAAKAVGVVRRSYLYMTQQPKLYRWGFGDTQGWGQEISACLAPALHTLQDSFSPAHVHRSQEPLFIILEIYAWDKVNKIHHSELDASWKNSALGMAAKAASGALIKCVVLAAVDPNSQNAFQDFAQNYVVDKYLRLSVALPNWRQNDAPTRSAFG